MKIDLKQKKLASVQRKRADIEKNRKVKMKTLLWISVIFLAHLVITGGIVLHRFYEGKISFPSSLTQFIREDWASVAFVGLLPFATPILFALFAYKSEDMSIKKDVGWSLRKSHLRMNIREIIGYELLKIVWNDMPGTRLKDMIHEVDILHSEIKKREKKS